MKALVFDSGPLISMTMNNVLWLLEPLKKLFKGEFIITQAVKEEVVDNPLNTKKFKFEALQINMLIEAGTLTVKDDKETDEETRHILSLANSAFSVKKQPLRIMQYADASVLSFARAYQADAIVVDERVTRELVEHPARLSALLRRRFTGHVRTNNNTIHKLKSQLSSMSVLRSVDLITVAFEKGLLNNYIAKSSNVHNLNPKKILLESLLWGLKTDGCSVSRGDIDYILEHEKW